MTVSLRDNIVIKSGRIEKILKTANEYGFNEIIEIFSVETFGRGVSSLRETELDEVESVLATLVSFLSHRSAVWKAH